MLENEARYRSPPCFGCTPLHEVSRADSEHLVKLLVIKAQADIEAKDCLYERTSLHLTAAHSLEENAAVLVKHGEANFKSTIDVARELSGNLRSRVVLLEDSKGETR